MSTSTVWITGWTIASSIFSIMTSVGFYTSSIIFTFSTIYSITLTCSTMIGLSSFIGVITSEDVWVVEVVA